MMFATPRRPDQRPSSKARLRLALAVGLSLGAVIVAAASANAFTQSNAPVPPTAHEWRRLAIAPLKDARQAVGPIARTGRTGALVAAPPRRLQAVRVAQPRSLNRAVIAAADGPVRISGVVGADLNASLRAVGVPDSLISDYIRALATRIDLDTGIGVTDRFDLAIDGGRLAFAGLDRVGASDLLLVRWSVGGRPDWIDANGGAGQAGMAWPVPPRVSSDFGMRAHPILNTMRFHRGIDLRAGWGQPIRAAADGQVMSAGWAGGYGRQVRIGHAGGTATAYAHMSSIAAASGQLVRRGQVIGYVGSSGLATGPHLHYEVIKNGTAINPRSVRFAGASQVKPAERQALRDRLRQLLMLKSQLS